MGSIDFYSVFYYTFVTISTVGYGDFSPRTLIGRIFVVFVILGGVAFFSVETGNFINILKLAAMGKVTFTARNNKLLKTRRLLISSAHVLRTWSWCTFSLT
jgi:voltage-gated potassium channel Kch